MKDWILYCIEHTLRVKKVSVSQVSCALDLYNQIPESAIQDSINKNNATPACEAALALIGLDND